jgi:site-specific DNA recombinase
MQRAALYARVSTDAQQKEGTIESQVAELRRQIALAGDALVKEYVDDGYSGAQMDRPALQALRSDAKSDTFEIIYFLAADRIARDVIFQNVIISELQLHKKRIVINGQEHVDKSENKFTLTVLGAVAELERAKITERMARGKLHRLRQGQVAGGGVPPYGYDYVRRTAERPAALIVNEPEAAVVRWMFETYAGGGSIARCAALWATGVPCRTCWCKPARATSRR